MPRAFGPCTVTGSPLPPTPPKKQRAWGEVGTAVVSVNWVTSTRVLPPPVTTRTSARVGLPWATATKASIEVTSAANSAREQRREIEIGIEPPFLEGLHRLGRGQVSWLPGSSAAPSRERCGAPSGWLRRGFHPVTVAGPRRLLTGLPLTTDRCWRAVYRREK